MNKTLIFFCISCCLLIFSIIVVCTGPVITGVVEGSWRNQNCRHYSDQRKYVDDKNLVTGDLKDEYFKHLKKGQHLCERRKAMYGLEYASLVSDLFFGVLCSLLSLLHYFGIGKYCEKITGIIGLACGVIGFILTLIYIIYSGYIFTNDGPGKEYDLFTVLPTSSSDITHYNNEAIYKLDKDRAYAKWDGSKYDCFYYDEDDEKDALYAKYNDLGKKQYNYHKDFELADASSEYKRCQLTPSLSTCGINSKYPNCDKLYFSQNDYTTSISFKYEYDKWVTSIIFGCFIIALNLGLAIFGFLLFSQSDGSSGHVAVK